MYQQLANITVVPKDWVDLMAILEDGVQGAGTHVYLTRDIGRNEAELGHYYFSKEVLEGNFHFTVWIVNKNWPLHDELAKRILLYQQVSGAFKIKLKRKT